MNKVVLVSHVSFFRIYFHLTVAIKFSFPLPPPIPSPSLFFSLLCLLFFFSYLKGRMREKERGLSSIRFVLRMVAMADVGPH